MRGWSGRVDFKMGLVKNGIVLWVILSQLVHLEWKRASESVYSVGRFYPPPAIFLKWGKMFFGLFLPSKSDG